MMRTSTSLPPRRIFRGPACDHGVRGGCAMCTKHQGQCDYGDCTRRATRTVTMRTGERRGVCAQDERVLKITGMIRR